MRKGKKGTRRGLSLILCGMFLLTGCSGVSEAINPEIQNDPTVSEALEDDGKTKEDLNLRLEDDFYGYYGYDELMSWKLDQYPQYSSFTMVMDEIKEETDSVLDTVLSDTATWEEGTPEYEIKKTYQLLMDMEARDQAGIDALSPAIDAITEAQDINSFVQACGLCYKDYGATVLIPFSVGMGIDQPVYEMKITQPAMICPVKDLKGENTVDTVNRVQSILTEMLRIGGVERKEAAKQSKKTAKMLGAVAAASMDTDTANVFFDYDYIKQEELAEVFPTIDTSAMLKSYGLDQVETFVLTDRESIETFGQYFTDENLDSLKAYAQYLLYQTYFSYGDSVHRNPAVGGDGRVSDDKLARNAIKTLYDEEIAYLWSRQYVSPEIKETAEKMVDEIHQKMKEHVEALDWMSEETKQGALMKLDKMGLKVAYPDEWENGYRFSGYEMTSPEDGGQLLEEMIRYSVYNKDEMLNRLGTREYDSSWNAVTGMVDEVNCFYVREDNNIYICGAMLREPFFSLDNSYVQNLGSMGMVIGHEITHGFDSDGSRFDENGLYHNWWTQEDREHFDDECKKIEDYYDQYSILDIYHVNGKKTLTENIADLGGLSLISDICPDNPEDLRAMYENYVNIWLTLESESALEENLREDVHSPAEARINAVLSSTDKFYEAFDIKPGDKMYIPKENRVGIW